MKLTKYEHAFLVLEEQEQKLVIDPGSYSPSVPELDGVCAIVITHVHGDHFYPEHIDEILAANPGAVILTNSEVAKELGNRTHQVVKAGDEQVCGPFKLNFYGETHAVIHEGLPIWQNIGVMVNDSMYYPGDSFTNPHVPVKVLAAPAGSPWSKIGEEMDFVSDLRPGRVFPTHNAHLSEIGLQGRDNWLQKTCEQIGAEYTVLVVGESIEI